MERGKRIGRQALHPLRIPMAGWKDIAFRVKDKVASDNVTILSAGIAFYAFLAIFPAIAAVVSIYGLVSDPTEVEGQLSIFSELLPPQALAVLQNQLTRVAQVGQTLSIGIAIAILLTVWSASRGLKALIISLNIVYNETERRGFVRFNIIGLLFTAIAIAFAIVLLSLVVASPGFLDTLGLSASYSSISRIVRWPALAVIVVTGLALLYRYGPNRKTARFHWVTLGSVVATLLWLGISALFSKYVVYFGNFNEIYGSLGAVIILLLWLYLSALSVLIGAEINAEVEHQTGEDTTTGPPRPMGYRGAYVADTLGESRETEE